MSNRKTLMFSSLIFTATMSVVLAGPNSPLIAPNVWYRGQTISEWAFLWASQVIETNLGGGTNIPETLNGVRLLPSATGPGKFEFDVTLSHGEAFVVSPMFVYGERYDNPNVPDDTHQLIVDLQIFEVADIEVILDGKVLLKGTGAELNRWYFGPTYLDPPIEYKAPVFRFEDENGHPVNATKALFIEGIVTVYEPLPPGRHTLIQHMSSPFFGDFDHTYNIIVDPANPR